MNFWSGIDVGATSTRAVLLGAAGAVHDATTAEHKPIHIQQLAIANCEDS